MCFLYRDRKILSTQTVHKIILKISLHFHIGHETIKHSEDNVSNFSRNIITNTIIRIGVSGCQYHNQRQGIQELHIYEPSNSRAS